MSVYIWPKEPPDVFKNELWKQQCHLTTQGFSSTIPAKHLDTSATKPAKQLPYCYCLDRNQQVGPVFNEKQEGWLTVIKTCVKCMWKHIGIEEKKIPPFPERNTHFMPAVLVNSIHTVVNCPQQFLFQGTGWWPAVRPAGRWCQRSSLNTNPHFINHRM